MAKIDCDIKINRSALKSQRKFVDVFEGFDNVRAIRKIFGNRTNRVLAALKVAPYNKKGYMWVDQDHKRLMVSKSYLKTGAVIYLYLDIVHELVHVKQMMQGKELFDENYEYLERPTELQAYAVAVKEAKRIGMKRKELLEYLNMSEWFDQEDFKKFCKVLKL